MIPGFPSERHSKAPASLAKPAWPPTSPTLTRQPLLQLGRRRHVHRALAVAVEQRGVGAVAQQQRADLHPVLGRRLVEGGELPEVHGVDAGPVLRRHGSAACFSCVANSRS